MHNEIIKRKIKSFETKHNDHFHCLCLRSVYITGNPQRFVPVGCGIRIWSQELGKTAVLS